MDSFAIINNNAKTRIKKLTCNDFLDEEVLYFCRKCLEPKFPKVSNSKNNPGREYYACRNDCGKFLAWKDVDDEKKLEIKKYVEEIFNEKKVNTTLPMKKIEKPKKMESYYENLKICQNDVKLVLLNKVIDRPKCFCNLKSKLNLDNYYTCSKKNCSFYLQKECFDDQYQNLLVHKEIPNTCTNRLIVYHNRLHKQLNFKEEIKHSVIESLIVKFEQREETDKIQIVDMFNQVYYNFHLIWIKKDGDRFNINVSPSTEFGISFLENIEKKFIMIEIQSHYIDVLGVLFNHYIDYIIFQTKDNYLMIKRKALEIFYERKYGFSKKSFEDKEFMEKNSSDLLDKEKFVESLEKKEFKIYQITSNRKSVAIYWDVLKYGLDTLKKELNDSKNDYYYLL